MNKNTDQIICNKIIPVIREVVNSKHCLKNIKLEQTLYMLMINDYITYYIIYYDFNIICIQLKLYDVVNEKHYYEYNISLPLLQENKIRINKTEYIIETPLSLPRAVLERIMYI